MGLLAFFMLLFLLLAGCIITGIVWVIRGYRTNNSSLRKRGYIFMFVPLLLLIALYINQNS